MQREVLDPLGMRHSSFTWREDQRTRPRPAMMSTGRAVPRSALTEQAAGGLHTTAADLAAFVAAGMTGPHSEPAGRGVLTPETVAALFAPLRLPDGSTTSLGYETPDVARRHTRRRARRQEHRLAGRVPDPAPAPRRHRHPHQQRPHGRHPRTHRTRLGTVAGHRAADNQPDATVHPPAAATHCSSSSRARCCWPPRSASRSLGSARGREVASGSGASLANSMSLALRCAASRSPQHSPPPRHGRLCHCASN